jgi:ribosomal protein S18 acetylase RimI-like enzyme
MSPLPEPNGLFETHLTVSDLDRAVAFYRDVVGLPVALELRERAAAFLWVGGAGAAMLGLWSLGSSPVGLSLHIALRAPLEQVLESVEALRAAGVTPLSFFGEETTEPSVIGWMPAVAVYFRDPDGHLIEYLAMLDEPARPELGIVGWSEWGAAERPDRPVRVERHTGPRDALRALFEEAEDSTSELDGYLDDGDVLVALAGDRVIGHLQLVDAVGKGASEIKNMAVDSAYRGRGVGRKLIRAAIDRTRDERRSTLVVATAAADVGNLRFYQRAGFRFRSVERDAFSPANGYAAGTQADGIELRDRVWLDLAIDTSAR